MDDSKELLETTLDEYRSDVKDEDFYECMPIKEEIDDKNVLKDLLKGLPNIKKVKILEENLQIVKKNDDIDDKPNLKDGFEKLPLVKEMQDLHENLQLKKEIDEIDDKNDLKDLLKGLPNIKKFKILEENLQIVKKNDDIDEKPNLKDGFEKLPLVKEIQDLHENLQIKKESVRYIIPDAVGSLYGVERKNSWSDDDLESDSIFEQNDLDTVSDQQLSDNANSAVKQRSLGANTNDQNINCSKSNTKNISSEIVRQQRKYMQANTSPNVMRTPKVTITEKCRKHGESHNVTESLTLPNTCVSISTNLGTIHSSHDNSTNDDMAKFDTSSMTLRSLLSTLHKPSSNRLNGHHNRRNNYLNSQTHQATKPDENFDRNTLLNTNNENKSELKNKVKDQMIRHTDSVSCNCFECKLKNFPSKKTIQNVIKCNHCDNKTFCSLSSLTRHLKTHSGLKSYVCHECCKGFTTKGSLESHKQVVHSILEPCKCSVCDKLFKNSKSLFVHTRSVHKNGNKNPTACDLCQKIYKNKEKMKSHRRDHHSNDKRKELICNDCSAVFLSRDALINHVKIHMPPLVKCAECSELFHTEQLLIRHMRIQHLIGKIYICDVCGKTATTKANLERHALIHDGKKPYICEECGKSFRVQSNLTQHSLSHSDIRPFSCDLCGKSFRIRHHLSQHMAVHGLTSTPNYGKRKLK